jgi:hypothetical protein
MQLNGRARPMELLAEIGLDVKKVVGSRKRMPFADERVQMSCQTVCDI